jgi:hypothetical protein
MDTATDIASIGPNGLPSAYYCTVGWAYLDDYPIPLDYDALVAVYSFGGLVGSRQPSGDTSGIVQLDVQSGKRLVARHPLSRTEPGALHVFDVAGRRVRAFEIPVGRGQTIISDLFPGVYFLRLHEGSQTARAKGVVVR